MTFMDILAGHQLPTKGTVQIDGQKPFDNRNVLQHICLIKEGGNFFKDVKVKELLKTYEFIYPKWDKELAEELVDIYKLASKAKKKAITKRMRYGHGVSNCLSSKA